MKTITKTKFKFNDFLSYIEDSDFIYEEDIKDNGHLALEIQEILRLFLEAKKENKDYIYKVTADNPKGSWYENYFYSSEGLAENQIYSLGLDGYQLINN